MCGVYSMCLVHVCVYMCVCACVCVHAYVTVCGKKIGVSDTKMSLNTHHLPSWCVYCNTLVCILQHFGVQDILHGVSDTLHILESVCLCAFVVINIGHI